jgi:hypothetical protein
MDIQAEAKWLLLLRRIQMKKQMFFIVAALVLGSVGHASTQFGDMVSDPNQASVSVHSPASAAFSAQKTEGDCPFRVKKAAAPEEATDSAPAKTKASDLVS